ncbi:hypothetical protein, unlikely [Trypanosoma congolense IL3000]|uniref:Actin-like protein n=1 Tax=Trypanosoma congolense (strain IL3000) TaxID=1068625 RepID=F9W5Y9_TRYCI|nr:hypothetical protein, unlikely [Trypanosoma congolense IL3000]
MACNTERAPVVILDGGSHHLRAGYAADGAPRLDIPALVGHPRNRGVAVAAGMNEYEIGDVALAKRGMLTVSNPIERGRVVSWENMEKLWGHVMYSELPVRPESHCFIVPQPGNTEAAQREKRWSYDGNISCSLPLLGASQGLNLNG